MSCYRSPCATDKVPYHGYNTRSRGNKSSNVATTTSVTVTTGIGPSVKNSNLLCGYYNKIKREQDVMAKFRMAMEKMETMDFSTDQQTISNDFGVEKSSTLKKGKSLEELVDEIQNLCSQVTATIFENGHFNHEYRTLEGTCSRLLEQLDNLDCGNDTSLRTERGKTVQDIEGIKALLKSKVHKDGKCCKDCPLYGTLWE